jgi:hypothetical protein
MVEPLEGHAARSSGKWNLWCLICLGRWLQTQIVGKLDLYQTWHNFAQKISKIVPLGALRHYAFTPKELQR